MFMLLLWYYVHLVVDICLCCLLCFMRLIALSAVGCCYTSPGSLLLNEWFFFGVCLGGWRFGSFRVRWGNVSFFFEFCFPRLSFPLLRFLLLHAVLPCLGFCIRDGLERQKSPTLPYPPILHGVVIVVIFFDLYFLVVDTCISCFALPFECAQLVLMSWMRVVKPITQNGDQPEV